MFENIEFIAKDNEHFLMKYFGVKISYMPSCCDVGIYHISIRKFNDNDEIDNGKNQDNDKEPQYINKFQYGIISEKLKNPNDNTKKRFREKRDELINKKFLIFKCDDITVKPRKYEFLGQYELDKNNTNDETYENIYIKINDDIDLIPFYYPSYDRYENKYVPYIQYDFFRSYEDTNDDNEISIDEYNTSNYIIDNMRLILMEARNNYELDMNSNFFKTLDELEQKLYSISLRDDNIEYSPNMMLEESLKVTKEFIKMMEGINE